MGQYSLTRFIGISFFLHAVFIASTAYYSFEGRKELPFRVRLIEIPDIDENTISVQKIYSSAPVESAEKKEDARNTLNTSETSDKEANSLRGIDPSESKIKSNDVSVPDNPGQSVQDLKSDKPKVKIEPKDDAFNSDTIPLDTKEIKYNSYFDSIKRKISSVWRYPDEAMSQGIKGSVVLRFSISREGALLDTMLLSSTNYKVLDEEAVRAVKTASPFDKIPDDIDKNQLNIIATFSYCPSFISDFP
ncbi:MAG: energy transducer TonB [Nitrospinae bacterium]|nr:energy transducer TonB [Nitrospinota bacterium]